MESKNKERFTMTREEYENRYHKSPEEVLEEMRKLQSEHPEREVCCPAADWALGILTAEKFRNIQFV